MNDLIFIKDVIYGLKREYGVPAELCRDSTVTNLETGVKTITEVLRQNISRVIFLPFSWRKFMAQKTAGIQEVGTQEILVDKADLPSAIVIDVGDYINANGKRIDIGKVDNYEYAFVLVASSIEGMPLG